MIYVFDTSSLITAFNNLQQDIFPTFWKKFFACIDNGKIISVREALHEVSDCGDRLSEWAKTVKGTGGFFSPPSDEELLIVGEIFQKKENQALISKQKRLKGGLVADPFVIAKAKHISGCVVTEDGFNRKGNIKENAIKIAPVCMKIGVDCVNFDGFMRREKWKF